VKITVWFPSLVGVVLVACGNLTSSPQDPPDNSPDEHSTAVQAGATHSGGSTGSSGGSSGGIALVMPTAGTTSSNTPLLPGTAGEGGQPEYPATVNLCIYPEDIPENWGAGGAGGADGAEASGSGRDCVVGVLGEFSYMGCHYQLLSETAFNVDPFVGGHSHCCYAAKLIACK
jgi:hypothetical protein